VCSGGAQTGDRQEQVRRQPRDLNALLLEGSRAGQRGGRSHTLEVIRLEPIPNPAHQHGDVAALAAPIRVQLIEHEEPQPLG
jgi:hypothetical protein